MPSTFVSSSDISKLDINNWWLHLLSGILMIIAGIMALANPIASYLFISVFFSVSLFISGIVELIFAFINRKKLQGHGWHITTGFIDLLIGAILLSYPSLTLMIIPFILAFWLMFRGSALITFSLYLHSLDDSQWRWLLAGGILLAFFASYIIIHPALGVATAVALVASGFLLTGITNIAFSFRLKKFREESHHSAKHHRYA